MLELVPGFDQPVILPPRGDILLKAAADVSAQILQEIASMPSPLWFREEGHTRWRERGWESPNSD
jgi:hypothetical protein